MFRKLLNKLIGEHLPITAVYAVYKAGGAAERIVFCPQPLIYDSPKESHPHRIEISHIETDNETNYCRSKDMRSLL